MLHLSIIAERVFKFINVIKQNCNPIKTPFKDGFPNEDWWLLFSKRHNLSIKKPQMVEHP